MPLLHLCAAERGPLFAANTPHALDWIDANQLHRRNLTSDQASLIRGRMYNRRKKEGFKGNQYTGGSGQNVHLKTAESLASEHGVSEKTICGDGQFAAAVETLKVVDPDSEKKVVSGKGPVKKDVVEAAKMAKTDPEKPKTILERVPMKFSGSRDQWNTHSMNGEQSGMERGFPVDCS
jgi:hypothetical protein